MEHSRSQQWKDNHRHPTSFWSEPHYDFTCLPTFFCRVVKNSIPREGGGVTFYSATYSPRYACVLRGAGQGRGRGLAARFAGPDTAGGAHTPG